MPQHNNLVATWANQYFGNRIAPNGDPAWQNFVRWFGDSQVTDGGGQPLVVYHGTARTFDQFDSGHHRTPLNTKYQSDGFHFTPSLAVASKYSDAARNQFLDRDTTLRLVDANMPPEIAIVFRDVVNLGYRRAWDMPGDKSSQIIQCARDNDIDINDLLDISEWVEGSNYHQGNQRHDLGELLSVLTGHSTTWLPDWVRDDAVLFGLQDALPHANVRPIFLRADAVLETDDPDEAAAAQTHGYDGVRYTGDAAVDGVPEWIVYGPEQIRSAIGDNGNFQPVHEAWLHEYDQTANRRIFDMTVSSPNQVITDLAHTEAAKRLYIEASQSTENTAPNAPPVLYISVPVSNRFAEDLQSKQEAAISGNTHIRSVGYYEALWNGEHNATWGDSHTTRVDGIDHTKDSPSPVTTNLVVTANEFWFEGQRQDDGSQMASAPVTFDRLNEILASDETLFFENQFDTGFESMVRYTEGHPPGDDDKQSTISMDM